MNKARRMLAAGLGAMTPAFIATDQGQARSIEAATIAPAQNSAPTIAPDQEALKRALLGLCPAEKLRIAGDRIRLARGKAQSGTSKPKPRAASFAACNDATAYCSGMLFAWK